MFSLFIQSGDSLHKNCHILMIFKLTRLKLHEISIRKYSKEPTKFTTDTFSISCKWTLWKHGLKRIGCPYLLKCLPLCSDRFAKLLRWDVLRDKKEWYLYYKTCSQAIQRLFNWISVHEKDETQQQFLSKLSQLKATYGYIIYRLILYQESVQVSTAQNHKLI